MMRRLPKQTVQLGGLARAITVTGTVAVTLLVAACGSDVAPNADGNVTHNPDLTDTRFAPGIVVRSAGLQSDVEVPPLDCESNDYPCSWSEADDGAWARSMEIAVEASPRMADRDIPAVAKWLAAQPEVIAIEVGPDVVGFRLQGGRFTWLAPPGFISPPTEEEAAEALVPGTRDEISPLARVGNWILPSAHAQIVGIDQNGDGRINQRDHKRALIVSPFSAVAFSGVYELLKDSPEYKDNVVVSRGYEGFGLWDKFDIVYVLSSSIRTCEVRELGDLTVLQEPSGENCQLRGIYTGDSVDMTATFFLDLGRITEPYINAGFDFVFEVGEQSIILPDDIHQITGHLMVTPDALQQAYQGSLRRKLIYLNVPYTDDGTNDLVLGILAPPFGESPDGSMLIARYGDASPAELHDSAMATFEALLGGHTAYEAPAAMRAMSHWIEHGVFPEPPDRDNYKTHLGQTVRAREIVVLVNDAGEPFLDGMPLPFEGTPDDGSDDSLSVIDVHAEGLIPAFFDTAYYPREPLVSLEIDGTRVGEPVALAAVNTGTFARFENIPLDFDLEAGRRYDVEAILELPGHLEFGQSRYAAELTAVDGDCWWYAAQTGPITREYRGDVAWAGKRLGSGGGIDLGMRSGTSPYGAVRIYLGDMPLAVGEFDMSAGAPGGIVASIPEDPNGGSTRGYVRLSVVTPERVEGDFDADVTKTEQGTVNLKGSFVWTPACPNR